MPEYLAHCVPGSVPHSDVPVSSICDARVLVWNTASTQLLCCCLFDVMSDCVATPRTVAYQSPLSMGFARQEYWSGLPFPPPGGLRAPAIEPASPALQADSLLLSHQGSPTQLVLGCCLNPNISLSPWKG